jgi:hypothetical protein
VVPKPRDEHICSLIDFVVKVELQTFNLSVVPDYIHDGRFFTIFFVVIVIVVLIAIHVAQGVTTVIVFIIIEDGVQCPVRTTTLIFILMIEQCQLTREIDNNLTTMDHRRLLDLVHIESFATVHPGMFLPIGGSHQRVDPVGDGADGGHPAAERCEKEEPGRENVGLDLAQRHSLLQELGDLAHLHVSSSCEVGKMWLPIKENS